MVRLGGFWPQVLRRIIGGPTQQPRERGIFLDGDFVVDVFSIGIFVGSGIFKSGDPAHRARAIVEATTYHQVAEIVAKVSRGLGEPMVGINVDSLDAQDLMQHRGL